MTARGRGRPPRHTTADVVAAGCRLADREGVDAVTMRRVAAELGIGAASLYTYVDTRDALLDLMVEAISAEYALGEPTGDGVADVVAVALQTRDLLRRHPWAAVVMEERPIAGPAQVRVLEHVLASLVGSAASGATKLAVYGAMNAVVIAYVRSENADHRVVGRTLERLAEAAVDGHHPHLAAALAATPTGTGDAGLDGVLTAMLRGVLGDQPAHREHREREPDDAERGRPR